MNSLIDLVENALPIELSVGYELEEGEGFSLQSQTLYSQCPICGKTITFVLSFHIKGKVTQIDQIQLEVG